MNDDNILVIVPPRPTYAHEFSYSNLYEEVDAGKDGDEYLATLPPIESHDVVSPTAVMMSSTKTLSSGHLTSLASLSSSSFDSSNVTVIADGRNNFKSVSSSIITRDPRNGAFTFQVHAEYDMLLRVQKDLDKHRRSRGPREGGSGSNYGTNNNNTITDDNASAEEESIRLSRRIMLSIDNYCLHEQWMYHIGHEKGEALSRFLRSCLESWNGNNNNNSGNNNDGKEVRKFICVELGTYCGYSALVLAITLRRYLLDRKQHDNSMSSSPFEFHIYTTDISTKILNVARSIFRLAGMETCITPILVQQQDCVVDNHHANNENSVNVPDDANTQDLGGYLVGGRGGGVSNNQYRGTYDDQGQGKVVLRKDDDEPHPSSSASIQPLSTILQEQYSISQIDFLLFDHAKHLYLHDLICLEQSKLVRKGTHVCADNVLYNRLDEYRSHMLELEQLRRVVDDENGNAGGCGCGVVETRLEEMNLEYTNNLKDGMGEFFSKYIIYHFMID
jgi:predicted O-methyltransferase YrrM